MVEYVSDIDLVFQSLADPTRRDILAQVSQYSLSVGEIAKQYDLTFAAVSKHIQVMERAKLVTKQHRGKKRIVSAVPATLHGALDYLKRYEIVWNERFDSLDRYVKNNPREEKRYGRY